MKQLQNTMVINQLLVYNIYLALLYNNWCGAGGVGGSHNPKTDLTSFDLVWCQSVHCCYHGNSIF